MSSALSRLPARRILSGTFPVFSLSNLRSTGGMIQGRFQSARAGPGFRKWSELELSERQEFIKGFVKNYKKLFPQSKTNLSLKTLSMDMDKFEDSPSVFGIFYNDIHKESLKDAASNANVNTPSAGSDNRFVHPSFHKLLYRNSTKA